MSLQMVGANSEPGKVILDCIKKLSTLVPPGSVTPQDKLQVIQKLALEAQKAGQQMQMMRRQQAPQPGAQQGAPGGAAPGGGAPQMPAA